MSTYKTLDYEDFRLMQELCERTDTMYQSSVERDKHQRLVWIFVTSCRLDGFDAFKV